MKIDRFIILLSVLGLIFLFADCKRKSIYPGFALSETGINYKLYKIGDEQHVFTPGDFFTADIVYKTIDDSVFFKGRRKIQVFPAEFEGAIDECFAMLSEGDSASFIISADSFFEKSLGTELPSFIPDSSMMIVDINVVEIQTEEEYYKDKEAFLSWISDFEEYEQVILKQFVEDESIAVNLTESGMYSVNVKKGNGVRVAYGDTITIHYEGWFLNGTFFDSTRKRRQPFTFVYGTEWQVIRGIEQALLKMTEKEKSVFIMPSSLAFGYKGSSTGIIPPFTSVIFEIELLEVKKGKTSNEKLKDSIQ